MPRRTATVDQTISSSRRSSRSTKAVTEEEKTEDETLESIEEEVEANEKMEEADLRSLVFLGKLSSTFEISSPSIGPKIHSALTLLKWKKEAKTEIMNSLENFIIAWYPIYLLYTIF